MISKCSTTDCKYTKTQNLSDSEFLSWLLIFSSKLIDCRWCRCRFTPNVNFYFISLPLQHNDTCIERIGSVNQPLHGHNTV